MCTIIDKQLFKA